MVLWDLGLPSRDRLGGNMQVGDLVADNYGNVGLIVEQMSNPQHFRVQWCGTDSSWESQSCTIHRNHLAVIC